MIGASRGGLKHLPYEIDSSTNRFHYYENLWKQVGLDLLRKHSEVQDKTMLDYGCGRGESIEIFSRAGLKVLGTDTDPECVRIAGGKGRTVVLDPADPVKQFGPKSFDVVTCFHVLEHVPTPVEILAALGQIARSYLVLAVPNLRCLNGAFARDFKLAHVNEGHLQGWDHLHFRSLAERHCGLELVEWGSDATILAGLSAASLRLFGMNTTIKLETGVFRRLFPFHCISVLGLFRPKQ